MADQKISQLTTIATVDTAADLFPIVDTSAVETKKITPTALKTALALNNVDNTTDANKPVSSATQTALDAKQATLVSGTNIKTINSTSILGSGNISVAPATAINATAVADGSVTNAEFQFIGGLTSDAQTQINGKEATITATTSADYYRGDKTFATLNKTAVGLGNVDNTSDANKPVSSATQTALNLKENTITATTSADYYRGDKTFATLNKSAVGLGNVDNTSDANKPVSTATQTALDTKTNKLIVTNRQTASYTLVLGDADKLVEINNASANNLTIPLNSSVAFATGTQILLAQYGAGQTTIVATSGVTVRSNGAKLKLNAQYSGATLIKIDTNEWYLFGDIAS
jgi:hypothetical protein